MIDKLSYRDKKRIKLRLIDDHVGAAQHLQLFPIISASDK